MKIGYARVSTHDQKLELQNDELEKAGCEKIFEEKISGKSKERPALQNMIEILRQGDSVVVWKLDRLGRSLRDLIDLVAKIQSKGADFISIKDSINTQTATGRFTFNIFASLAEFEREIIRERTMAGLTAAKARGRMGGRPKGLTKKAMDKAHSALLLYNSKKKTVDEIAGELGLSRATCYRYIDIAKEMEAQKV
ncbi:MAG TPA: recombinase family protein [Pedobacter sp.]|jgi:DNA invertase Pin-like site-specific DNA recombinase